ncbi:MAG: YihY/virulence factor BrkB family protein [Caulobacteraceae bacterium]
MTAGPITATANPFGVIRRALARLWGRDVMLYTGGVSFYAMLAGAPGLAILVSIYSLLSTPEIAARQASNLALLLPDSAQQLFTDELQRLARAPLSLVGLQGVVAIVISVYAAHRGVKALIAGLSFINEDEESHSFLEFNIMAMTVFLAGLALLLISSTGFLVVRVVLSAVDPSVAMRSGWPIWQWLWAGTGLTAGLTLMYRYVMSADLLGWRAAITGGVAGALMSLTASWASAFYVDRVARLGATYGSVAAVVVCLIWISWNVNAAFFGGALATETDLALRRG